MSKRSILSLTAASALTALLAGPAAGQAADFVLFGDSVEAAPETRAVHPVTAPYFHEDSYITSDVRAWFVHHNFPSENLGGDAQVVAVQIRLALTQQLQLVAYKDGYTWFNDDVVDDEGWNDLAAGLKYAFLQDAENDLFAAVGVGYQFAFGDESALQNDQEARFWASVNKGFGPLHLGATANYLLHTGDESAVVGSTDRITWHLHADYYVNEYFSPVVELNGYHVVSNGDNAPLPFSGVDVANLGGGSNAAVVTMGVGAEFRPLESLGLRVAYEFPLTDNEDLFGDRITASAVFSF
jgi:hypothetical protein